MTSLGCVYVLMRVKHDVDFLSDLSEFFARLIGLEELKASVDFLTLLP